MIATLSANIPLPRLGREPPREVRLFRWGLNPTTKGPFTLTEESARKVMEQYTKEGHALTFDYEHAAFSEGRPQDKIAAGTFRLSVKGDGIWATDIQWTPRAAEGIKNGEWVFVSPALRFTPKGEIVGIRNVALTNLPATHNAMPLLLSQRGTPMDKSYLKLCKDAMSGAEALMGAAQSMAQTDDPTMKELGGKAVEVLPSLISALQELIEAETGEDVDGDAEKGELSQLLSLRTLCEELTGGKGLSVPALRGKLRALGNKQRTLTAQLSAKVKSEKEALVDKGIAEFRIPAAERATFLSQSREEIEAYLSAAEPLVPAPVKEVRQPIAPPTAPAGTAAADEETLSTVDAIFRAAGRPDLARN